MSSRAPVLLEEVGMRRAYLVTLAIALLLVTAIWTLTTTPTLFLRVTIPALAVYLGFLLFGLWSRVLPLHATGILLFLVPVTVVFGRLVLWQFGVVPGHGGLGDSVEARVTWLAVVFPLAFLVFGTRRGAQVSLLLYLVFVAIYAETVIDVLLGRSSDPLSLIALSRVAVFAILIALIWVLASRLERLVAERARADMLAMQSTTDVLTGIANRRRLDDELDRLVAQSRRYGQPLSLVLLDLDNFKAVNDTHGHDTGDQVLVEVVPRLSASVRETDLVGRWGGEEFLLLAPHTDHQAACTLAERCRAAITQTPMTVGTVTASFGVATLESDDDVRALIRRADLALYAAKREGRDRVVGIISPDEPDGSEARRIDQSSGRL